MVSMNIKFIELSPFGCRIDRGRAMNIEDLPEGYVAKSIKTCPDTIVIYIEPSGKSKKDPKNYQY